MQGRDRAAEKRAWIDPEQKLVSFHEIPQARLLECEEERFWVSVLRFVAAGYRIQ